MSTIASTTTQHVLDEIETLKSTISSFGEAARTKLADIEKTEADVLTTLPLTLPRKIDEAAWSQKNEKDQNTAYTRLLSVRDSLRSTAGLDGPTDEEHLMYGGYASNKVIIAWLFISFLIVGMILGTIVYHWEDATSSDFTLQIQKADASLKALAEVRKKESAFLAEEAKKVSLPASELEKLKATIEIAQRDANAAVEAIGKVRASEKTVFSMVVLLGALGGSLHLVGSLVMYIGNGQLKRRWLPYYLSLPIAGAALAPIVYMLLRVGTLAPTGTANPASGTSNLNLVGIYAFAALTGMFAKTATDKLSEVFSTIFRTGEQPTKDKISSGKAASSNL